MSMISDININADFRETSPKDESELSDEVAELKLQLEIQKMQAEIDELRAGIDDTKNNTQMRKDLADKTFSFMEKFTIFSALIFWLYIASFLQNGKEIPESVMITFITTTLATVIGLMVIILKGMFGSK
ncbi:hypothetical protein V4V60_004050 [Vibrio mimicus]